MPVAKVKTQKSKVKTTTQKSNPIKSDSKVVKSVKEVKKVTKGHPERAMRVEGKSDKPTTFAATLSVALYDNTGKAKGTVKLPAAVFGAKINKPLMAQAVRVYLANQRMGSASAKTRGEVVGSTRKIYRQKGTGRARHGGIRAPIFVGGGAAHGPKRRDYSLNLSSKMRKAALASALSAMAQEGKVNVIAAFKGMELVGKKVLLVTPEKSEKVFKASRNIAKMKVSASSLITTYDVLNSGTLVVMEEALEAMKKQFKGENK